MATQEFPSNTSKPNPQKPEVKPEVKRAPLQSVVQGNVIVKKPSVGSRFKSAFAGEDGKTVAQAVLVDVIIPSIKDMLFQTISQGADRMLFGTTGRRRTGTSATGQRIDFNAISQRTKGVLQRGGSPEGPTASDRARHDFSRIYFETRNDALNVLEQMQDQISQFGWVTVSDFYSLCSLTGDFQDEKWGWDNISTGRPVPSGGSYILDLPAPIPEA